MGGREEELQAMMLGSAGVVNLTAPSVYLETNLRGFCILPFGLYRSGDSDSESAPLCEGLFFLGRFRGGGRF